MVGIVSCIFHFRVLFLVQTLDRFDKNQEEIEKQLDEQLQAGVVIPSINPGSYQASCTVVRKKTDPITGEQPKRVAIDYTGLNANTRPKTYPIPRIDRIIKGSLKFTRYIVIDIKSAYNHIPVKNY